MRSKEHLPDTNDMHTTAYTAANSTLSPLKVSGSAYKLTRLRALHHGTCLLASPHLGIVSTYLRSPAAPFLKARGVESVRSPVGNIFAIHEDPKPINRTFQRRVIEAFADLHELEKEAVTAFIDTRVETCLQHDATWVTGYIDDAVADIPEVKRGIRELESPEWIYEQTPQFVLSSHPTEEDDRARPALPQGLPPATGAYLKVRSGIIASSRISMSADEDDAQEEAAKIHTVLQDRKLHQIVDWQAVLDDAKAFENIHQTRVLARWLSILLGY
ncbi:lipoyltransferase and lipoate-protein ligase [Lasallia pustulata]|uniref:Putative lipoate-protein ligase A n=1 Tax=Lasallia pustulata TaxID=136370 RepID=A0A1W5DBI5_9LECA|nr:lipoyltransferase and lipoate-protein ligase [Lasallia pustulata]